MGFFDRFSAKKPSSPAAPTPAPEPTADSGGQGLPTAAAPGAGIRDRLVAAREKLEAGELEAALALYEELLATAGDRADVLVTVSGDLGAHGHVGEIIELIAPRYDAQRHGPATGLNLIQAYLAVRDPEPAQHVLDILFGLNRPELEDRLHGFSNAIAEMLAAPEPAPSAPLPVGEGQGPKMGLVSISKPIWFYGLEPLAASLLPPKQGRLRRIAFAQLALPGYPDVEGALNRPEDELARLARAIPVWLAETFHFSENYDPIAALGIISAPGLPTRPMIFAAEWTVDNLRQLVETSSGLDYIVTGALKGVDGDYDLFLRVFEVKSFRERKRFTARWTPATADAELGRLHADVRRFMEWSPASATLAYVPPPEPRAWLETVGASATFFLADKGVVASDIVRPGPADLEHAARHAASGESAALAFLTLRTRAAKLGVPPPPPPTLARSAVVRQAAELLG